MKGYNDPSKTLFAFNFFRKKRIESSQVSFIFLLFVHLNRLSVSVTLLWCRVKFLVPEILVYLDPNFWSRWYMTDVLELDDELELKE